MAIKVRSEHELTTSKYSNEVVFVDKYTECHVTPIDVAGRMVKYASPLGDVLEPSAGTGNIVQALLEYGISPEQITSVEKHTDLASRLKKRFDNKVAVFNQCFLQFAQEIEMRFDTIIMNPPFRPIKHHVEAAQTLLKNNGRIILLSPVSFEKEDFTLIEELHEHTFATTKVKTHILEYQKD